MKFADGISAQSSNFDGRGKSLPVRLKLTRVNVEAGEAADG